MKQRVISFYPLTGSFKDRIEAEVGPVVDYLAINTRKNLGVADLVREIRSVKAQRTIIAVEHEHARTFAAPLFLVALLQPTNRISFFWPDGELEGAGVLRALPIMAEFVGAQAESRLSLRSYAGLARRLARRPRATAGEPRSAQRGGKVVYLDANPSAGLAVGGSVGHTRGVIAGFVEHGFGVDYVSIKPLNDVGPSVRRFAPPQPKLLAYPSELNYFGFNRRFEEYAGRHIATADAAFLYQRFSLHNLSGVRLKLQFGLPLVLEYNGSEAWAHQHWGEPLVLQDAATTFERCALQAAHLVVTVSQPLVDEVLALGVAADRVVLYPNCIDPALFSPERFAANARAELRGRLGIAADARVATFIGTFGQWHGVTLLAEGIRRLVDTERDYLDRNKLHFLLIGDGLNMPLVRERIGGAPYDRYVTLTGLIPQDEAPAHLAASDIFLSPHLSNKDNSAFFGSPTKLFEYMAMERPIVAADLDQIGKVLRRTFFDEGRDLAPLAALFPPGDLDAMLAAFRWVVEHPEPAQQMAQEARREVLARYTWAAHVGAVLDRMTGLGLLEPVGDAGATAKMA